MGLKYQQRRYMVSILGIAVMALGTHSAFRYLDPFSKVI